MCNRLAEKSPEENTFHSGHKVVWKYASARLLYRLCNKPTVIIVTDIKNQKLFSHFPGQKPRQRLGFNGEFFLASGLVILAGGLPSSNSNQTAAMSSWKKPGHGSGERRRKTKDINGGQ